MNEIVFELFIPALSLIGGVYLIYRGLTNLALLQNNATFFGGLVSSDSSFRGFLTDKMEVYSKLSIQCMVGGSNTWTKLAESVRFVSFSINDTSIDPTNARFDVMNCVDVLGYLPKNWESEESSGDRNIPQINLSLSKSVISQTILSFGLGYSLSRFISGGFTYANPSDRLRAKHQLSHKIVEAMKEDPDLSQKIKKYENNLIRVRELFISPESNISILYSPLCFDQKTKTIRGDFLITDKIKDSSIVREKAIILILIGLVLVGVSAYFFFIFMIS